MEEEVGRDVVLVSKTVADRHYRQFLENSVKQNPLPNKHVLKKAADNYDVNSSSTTATDSFHGTAISMMQNLFNDLGPNGVPRAVTSFPQIDKRTAILQLPDHFAIVSEVCLKTDTVPVRASQSEITIDTDCCQEHGNLNMAG
eukprot:Lithocolla_globosa_v1_NODE_1137_length_2843_cov_20.852941.p2 type:complete len:143 gc:universal NODE_1137_length_2843_cov_20.852941:657-1085(+)